jgi:carboxypeptidase family protein
MNSNTVKFAPILVFSVLLARLAAQTGTGILSGTVTNPSGTAVANAKISVRNLASGQTTEVQSDAAGLYTVPNLAPGDYEVSVSAEGIGVKTDKVTIAGATRQTMDLRLNAAATPTAPSLGDLGFTPEEAKGNVQAQARLDKRSHMLKTHQRLGLITTAPLIATLITSSSAGGRHGTASGRELHAALGSVTAGLYLTTASFAIFAPKVPGTTVRGPIRLHRALAWIHGPGMILTPVLGAMAYNQRSNGEKLHGVAQAHSAVAIVTGAAYGLAILSVSIKF